MMKIALASAVAAVSLFAAGAPADAHGFKRDNPYGHHHYKANKRSKAFYKYKKRKAKALHRYKKKIEAKRRFRKRFVIKHRDRYSKRYYSDRRYR